MIRAWSDLHSLYESRGDFQKLVDLDGKDIDLKELPARTLAAQARAFALLEQYEEAIKRIEILRMMPVDLESRCVSLLAQATLFRKQERWEEALQEAVKARTMAGSLKNDQLIADAAFGEALALMEMGQLFQSHILFDQIRQNSKISVYRRQLASINVAWVFWDLGRVDVMESLVDELPPHARPRVELSIHLARGDRKKVESLWKDLSNFDGLPQNERFFSALFLVEAGVIMGLPGSPDARVIKTLENGLASSIVDIRVLAAHALDLAKGTDEFTTQIKAEFGAIPMLKWRAELFKRFLECLRLKQAAVSTQRVRLFYLEKISPLLDARNLNSALMPKMREDGSFLATQGWTSYLGAFLAGEQVQAPSRQASLPPLRLRLENGFLTAFLPGTSTSITVDLRRSQISQKALEVIATHPSKILSKKDFHERLTRSRYNSVLHDFRLLKLLRRLDEKLRSHGVEGLFELPRDNNIHVKADLIIGG